MNSQPSADVETVTAADAPEVLTVEEAARVLRISRGVAYALAREWRTTQGRSGLPVIELGRSLRVPRAALDRLIAGAPSVTAA